MAQIFPFRGYRYNPQRVDMSRVLTQPYDKITPQMQDRYYELDEHNLVRIERGRVEENDTLTNNVYTRAATSLQEWIAGGILVREGAPAVYVCSQEYALPGARTRHVRRGFIALARVEDYSAGVVFRHELTHAGPKADRLELLRQTRAHTGQLFMLCPDRERRLDELLERLAKPAPALSVTDEYEVAHKLWPITDPAAVAEFVRGMENKKLVIADGHHRYETALAYRDECREKAPSAGPDAPHEKVMMTIFPTHGASLTILPTHRILTGIPSFEFPKFRRAVEPIFDWYAYPFSSDAERAAAFQEFRHDFDMRGRSGSTARRTIGVYPGGQSAGGRAFYLFVLKRGVDLADLLPDVAPAQHQLDVVLLHRLLLERGLGVTANDVERGKYIAYEREMDEGIAAVDRGEAQMACLLNPVRVEKVCELALAGQVLPQKSTDFYPKLLSGMAIYCLDEPGESTEQQRK
jgi:uncharacterized protein (DUF1015 family)